MVIVDIGALELIPPREERELDQKRESDDGPPQLLDQRSLGAGSAARGENVVVNQHAHARPDHVSMQLERVRAVLQGVLDGHGTPG
jgi:hypothetical protein